MAKVFVGLSGGVDSSVSAALLARQGHEVVGVYLKNWTQDVAGVACPWASDLADARAAAAVLDIPFKVYDFQDQYRQQVVDVMVAEYLAGRTPNPDVLCNQDIKFKLFLDAALADGADMIATGHYAQAADGRLLVSRDDAKDQTYFLYRVSESALKKALFPVGHLTKSEVRQLATEFKLPTATKPDSQGICFVGEVGIRPFLKQFAGEVPAAEPGPVVNVEGQTLGQHEGAIYYTIGQRHGLGIGGGQPYYVTAKDVKTNTIVVTTDPEDLSLKTDHFTLEQAHWIGPIPILGQTYKVRLRHRGQLYQATLQPQEEQWKVQLKRPAHAVAVGQSAVVYDGDTVLGGGIISL